MDPFATSRPQPMHTHKRSSYQNGYNIVPESLEITPGPQGYDKTYREPHTITNRLGRLDANFADPCSNGNVYPKHLVYRRKNGDAYVLPAKREDPATTPNLRIMPQTALYANMILRYYGYYVEKLPGGDPTFPEYGHRVRQVEVYYHVDDDTISVFEPYLENSGLPQGLTCPRRLYYWPGKDSTQRRPYRLTDFKLGGDYQIAQYKIHLYNADEFTKNFWKEQMPLDSFGRSGEPLVDPVWEKSQARREACKPHDAKVKLEESTTQHQKVYHLEIAPEDKLQFVGIVDDTLQPMARCRPVVVEYYLVDETIKVMEYRIENDAHQFGSDLNSVIRRGRIPRGIVQQGFHFLTCPFHKPYITEFYNPTDFFIDNTLFLYGKKILLVESNAWSRKWIEKNLGVEIKPNVDWRDKYRRKPRESSRNMIVPNYTGYGSYDDSMKSVLEIDPQIRPPNELPELCNSDDIIKFSARLYSRHADSHIPEYSILYYVSDDTMALFEHRVKGDASYGRKFLARQKCPLPEFQGDAFQRTPYPTPCYDSSHLIPGNILTICGTRFLLILPDPHIERIFKRHPLLFSCEQQRLIRQAIEDDKPIPAVSQPFLTDEELKTQVVPRAAKLMQRLKYWILHNPSFLMLLLSANDDEDLCIMTAGLLEDVCQAGKVDCDRFSAEEVFGRARRFYGRIGDQILYIDEFIRFVFQHGKGLAECEREVNPPGPDPLLKFRLDLHEG